MFTLGGGGAHCLGQALRRERLADERRPAIDAARVIADLRELDRRTGGPEGARRLAWTQSGERRAGSSASCWRTSASSPSATRPGTSGLARGRRAGARARLASRLGPRGRLARRRARGDGGPRRAARMGRRRRASAAPARAGRLGRRGGRPLRPQPVRQLRLRRHPRPGRGRGLRDPRARGWRTCWRRTASSWTARLEAALAPRGGRRLPRAPHRAGAGARGGGPARRRRRPAASGSSATASASAARPRTRAPRRWTRRRDAGLAAAETALRIERIAPRARRAVDDRRARAPPRDRQRRGRRGGARRGPTPRRRRRARGDARRGDRGRRGRRRRARLRARRRADLGDRADRLRPGPRRPRPAPPARRCRAPTAC